MTPLLSIVPDAIENPCNNPRVSRLDTKEISPQFSLRTKSIMPIYHIEEEVGSRVLRLNLEEYVLFRFSDLEESHRVSVLEGKDSSRGCGRVVVICIKPIPLPTEGITSLQFKLMFQ